MQALAGTDASGIAEVVNIGVSQEWWKWWEMCSFLTLRHRRIGREVHLSSLVLNCLEKGAVWVSSSSTCEILFCIPIVGQAGDVQWLLQALKWGGSLTTSNAG